MNFQTTIGHAKASSSTLVQSETYRNGTCLISATVVAADE